VHALELKENRNAIIATQYIEVNILGVGVEYKSNVQ